MNKWVLYHHSSDCYYSIYGDHTCLPEYIKYFDTVDGFIQHTHHWLMKEIDVPQSILDNQLAIRIIES